MFASLVLYLASYHHAYKASLSEFLSEDVLVVLDRELHCVLKYQLMEKYPYIGCYH